jgi:ankyrin repeat protein
LDYDDMDAARLLLDHGADPNEGAVAHPSGEPSYGIPSLHQAARRLCSAATAEMLLSYGAEGVSIYKDHTAYGLAKMYGNQAVAEVLEAAGQASELSQAEHVLAEAAVGESKAQVVADDLTNEQRCLLTRILATKTPLAHAQRLVAVGIDPEWSDEMQLSALHVAGWHGHADVVAWLLSLGVDVHQENAFGGDGLQTVMHGADFCPARKGRDYATCTKLLLEAGASFDPSYPTRVNAEPVKAVLQAWATAVSADAS